MNNLTNFNFIVYCLYTGGIQEESNQHNYLTHQTQIIRILILISHLMLDSIDQIEDFIHKNIDNYTNSSNLLSDVAYECLKDAILSVDVHSGDPLSEPRLSNALGISRTPVRTAIQQLVQDGLLQLIPGRAVVIASRSIKQVLDAQEVRRLLEPEVCRLVAGKLPPVLVTEFKDITQQLLAAAQQTDRATWMRVDVRWHEILCQNCPNELMGQMVLQAKNHMHKQGVGEQVSDAYLLSGTEEHVAIAEAIVEGDGALAGNLMLQHLEGMRKHLFPHDT